MYIHYYYFKYILYITSNYILIKKFSNVYLFPLLLLLLLLLLLILLLL